MNDDCAEFCNVHDPKDMEDAILRMAARSDTLDEAKIRAAAKPFDSVAVAEHAVQIYREALENTKINKNREPAFQNVQAPFSLGKTAQAGAWEVT